jgi:tetratricopeptide (TPR) repeat protein
VAHNNLAYALLTSGRLDEALVHALEASRISPKFAEAQLQAGLILEAKGKLDDALRQYRGAVALRQNWPLTRKKLADLLARTGKAPEAIEQYSAILQMTPEDAESHRRIAELFANEKNAAQAIAHYRAAIRLDANEAEAFNNLAWIYASDPQSDIRNGKEAVALATRACELTGYKQPLFVGTLAAAYAEAGQLDEAVRTAEQAASLARAAGLSDLAATNERLKNLYAEKKTFRESPASK